MTNPFIVIAIALVACAFLTAAITGALCWLGRSRGVATALGGLTLPALLCAYGIYDLNNLEVDSPPPGMLIIGGMIALAGIGMITLTIGFLVSRAMHRGKVS